MDLQLSDIFRVIYSLVLPENSEKWLVTLTDSTQRGSREGSDLVRLYFIMWGRGKNSSHRASDTRYPKGEQWEHRVWWAPEHPHWPTSELLCVKTSLGQAMGRRCCPLGGFVLLLIPEQGVWGVEIKTLERHDPGRSLCCVQRRKKELIIQQVFWQFEEFT